jgi:hypothetical protein
MKKSLIFAAVLLIAAIGLMLYGNSRSAKSSFDVKLADILPPAPEGWTVKTREIASTPEMKEAVGELLNYDDGVFVDYTSGVYRISVYIAYWSPGKMSHRLVAVHTPDVCWVGNGWKKEKSEIVVGLSANGRPLPPAEGRLFSARGNPEYVWFWHVVGSHVKSYATGFAPPWYAAITDILEKGINQREEQFFIRLSSSIPLDSLSLQPALQLILAKLPLPDFSVNN